MSSFTIEVGRTFSVGETVYAFPADKFDVPPAGGPPGTATTSAVVASNGTLSFTGLVEDRSYFAYAASPSRYMRFRVDEHDDQPIAGMYRGDWAAGTYYSHNDIVTYNGAMYSANADGSADTFDTGSWTALSAGGTVADEGVDLVKRQRLNFLGAGVTASDDSVGGTTNVSIPGASGVGIPVFNVKSYGATGDGTTNDTAAITAALAAAGTSDVIIYFPAGVYKDTAQRSFANSNNVTIMGPGVGQTVRDGRGHLTCEWRYSGTSAPFIDGTHSNGIRFIGIAVTYTSGSFTGVLVNLDQAYFIKCEDFYFGGAMVNTPTNTPSARAAMTLGDVAWGQFTNGTFARCQNGVWGFNTALVGFSNAIEFSSVTFVENTVSVRNPAFQWTFLACIFESTHDYKPAPIVVDTGGGATANVTFHGCGFWDVTTGSGISWFKASKGVSGISFTDCYIECPSDVGSFFDLTSPTTGIRYHGNYIPGGDSPATPLIKVSGGDSLSIVRYSSAQSNKLGPFINNAESATGPIVSSVNTQTYTLQLTDAGRVLDCGYNSGDSTITIPPRSDVQWPANTVITVRASLLRNTTIAAGAGVTIIAPNGATTLQPRQLLTLINTAAPGQFYSQSDTWIVQNNDARLEQVNASPLAPYTLVRNDAGTTIEANDGTTTVTIPNDSSVSFPIGTRIRVLRIGTTAPTLTPAAGVTLRTRGGLTSIGTQWGQVELRKRAANSWVATGDLS